MALTQRGTKFPKIVAISKFLEPELYNETNSILSPHKFYAPLNKMLSLWWRGACILGTPALHLYQYSLFKSLIYEYFEACNKISGAKVHLKMHFKFFHGG